MESKRNGYEIKFMFLEGKLSLPYDDKIHGNISTQLKSSMKRVVWLDDDPIRLINSIFHDTLYMEKHFLKYLKCL